MDKKYKISVLEGCIMIIIALFIDGIQFFVAALNAVIIGSGMILNKLISIFVYIFFMIWFVIKGVRLSSFIKVTGGFFGELFPVPFMSIIPFWTGAVVFVILKERKVSKTVRVLTRFLGKK